mmetsp:Transcript_18754/g.52639  ORF Transcript_18754/g.52639 Transcript_18754/m.52639 type:complete len:246 (-) Transcript_18754:614-1351(-)
MGLSNGHSRKPPRAFRTPPLINPDFGLQEKEEGIAARIQLGSPLLQSLDVRHLVALCATADALIERVARLKLHAKSFDVSILQEIEAACKELFPESHPQDTLRSLGLLGVFPYLAQGLVLGKLAPVDHNPSASYLHYVTLMNQVVMMGTQIYHDACNEQHHKYVAHQLALLYQCLNLLQGDTKPIRRVIESHFEEIKSVSESKYPFFGIEISDWLQEVTWLCREEIRKFPPYMHRRLRGVMRVVQ